MKVVIIGGGAAGASAAARLRRLNEHAEILILEKTNEISIANCGLPYYVSDVISSRENMLVSSPDNFKNQFKIEVRLQSEVVKIEREEKNVILASGEKISYDKLVLTTGASPFKPDIKGINEPNIFTVRTLSDADNIKNYIKANNVKNALVIGGGFIGIEMAENFAHLGLQTTLIEASSQILPPLDEEMCAYAQNKLRDNGIEIILSDSVTIFENGYAHLNSGRKIQYDIAVMAIGVRVENALALECGLKLGVKGAIVVDDFMQTSDPNIYAAGDNCEVEDYISSQKTLIPLAGPANRQGRIIADNICGIKSCYKKSLGTAVVKVFDLTLATVGNNERQLKASQTEYLKTTICANSHASYYPGATMLCLKLLFSPQGKIFGAQAIGKEGVEKRIDVISSLIRANATIQDLIDSELCYAPPYSSAKDPVNLVGMSAQNVIQGLLKTIYPQEIQDALLIDVRPSSVFQTRTIEGAINIPMSQLRERMNEIPRDKKVVMFCHRGYTSYVASRVLMQAGYDNVYCLCGGMLMYSEYKKNLEARVIKANIQASSPLLASAKLRIDACGMQCPGPVLKLSQGIKTIGEGETLEILTTDESFKNDIQNWCKNTGNTLLGIETSNNIIKASIQKGLYQPIQSEKSNAQTIVVFSNDLDKALAAFIIALGARAMGKEVTMFFTFWGLNILRKAKSHPVKKSIIDKMFGLMMPKGSSKLTLSKMHMAGAGTAMMKVVMKNKNIDSLESLIENAQNSGIKFIACQMSMDVMGIKHEELLDNVEVAGVASYIANADKSNSNLFI